MRILIVDDEEGIREVIKEYANLEGYIVYEASNGIEAINLVKKYDFNLIVMDIMMPKLDGYSACIEIKKVKDIPIIMLSARSHEIDKLQGFDIGIDDYLIKPFSPKELMARIKAVIKRNKICEKYVYKDLEIDFQAHTVKIREEEIKLTPKEYDLLCYFVNNTNIAISREQLLSKLWGYDFFGDDRTVDTHIKMLRNNLKEYRSLIVTIRGLGYKFEIKE